MVEIETDEKQQTSNSIFVAIVFYLFVIGKRTDNKPRAAQSTHY